jgi:outer membrane protein assembly factor BamB
MRAVRPNRLLPAATVGLCLWVVLAGCRAALRPPRDLSLGHRFRATSDPVISSPVAWDVDGDGVLEIAVGSWDSHFYLLDADLNDLPGWPKRSRRGFFSSPALADLDADGAMEIVVGSDRGMVYAWNPDASSVSGFPVDLGSEIWSSPTILEGPLIAIGAEERMVILTTSGQDADGWPQPMDGWADATAASDGRLLVISSLTRGDPSQGWLTVWTHAGERLPGFPVALTRDSDSSPAIVNFDGDGETWFVVGDDAGYLHVFDREGRERPGFPVRTRGIRSGPTPTPHPPGGTIHAIEASPAVADLDGDGTFEIVVGSWDGRLYVWDDTGRALPGWPVQVDDQIISSAALVDLDGDVALDIVVGSKDGHLYGWTHEAKPLPGFPHDLGAPVFSSPWVGDLEADGRADIVVGADNGIHLLQDVGSLGQRAWPMFHRDPQHTGAYP